MSESAPEQDPVEELDETGGLAAEDDPDAAVNPAHAEDDGNPDDFAGEEVDDDDLDDDDDDEDDDDEDDE